MLKLRHNENRFYSHLECIASPRNLVAQLSLTPRFSGVKADGRGNPTVLAVFAGAAAAEIQGWVWPFAWEGAFSSPRNQSQQPKTVKTVEIPLCSPTTPLKRGVNERSNSKVVARGLIIASSSERHNRSK
jgi:hypothetical protein